MLDQIGVKLRCTRRRTEDGAKRVYNIDIEEYAKFMAILEQRSSAFSDSQELSKVIHPLV